MDNNSSKDNFKGWPKGCLIKEDYMSFFILKFIGERDKYTKFIKLMSREIYFLKSERIKCFKKNIKLKAPVITVPHIIYESCDNKLAIITRGLYNEYINKLKKIDCYKLFTADFKLTQCEDST